jgi:hypothetical protein
MDVADPWEEILNDLMWIRCRHPFSVAVCVCPQDFLGPHRDWIQESLGPVGTSCRFLDVQVQPPHCLLELVSSR